MQKGIITQIKTYVDKQPFYIDSIHTDKKLTISLSDGKSKDFTGITRKELLQFCNECKDNRFWVIFKDDDPYY